MSDRKYDRRLTNVSGTNRCNQLRRLEKQTTAEQSEKFGGKTETGKSRNEIRGNLRFMTDYFPNTKCPCVCLLVRTV